VGRGGIAPTGTDVDGRLRGRCREAVTDSTYQPPPTVSREPLGSGVALPANITLSSRSAAEKA